MTGAAFFLVQSPPLALIPENAHAAFMKAFDRSAVFRRWTRMAVVLFAAWLAALAPVFPAQAETPASAPGRRAMLALRQAMFEAMLRAGQAAPENREAVLAHYPVRPVDLNGDGAPEYLMTGPCGLVCVCRAFARNPDGSVRILLTAPCMQEGLSALKEKDGGWNVLMSPIASYSAGGVKRFYAMRQGSYREIRKECYRFVSRDDPRLVRRQCPDEGTGGPPEAGSAVK